MNLDQRHTIVRDAHLKTSLVGRADSGIHKQLKGEEVASVEFELQCPKDSFWNGRLNYWTHDL